MATIQSDSKLEYTVIREVKLSCTEDGHDKFWYGILAECLTSTTPYMVVVKWGRYHTVGAQMEKHFTTKRQAESYLSGRIRDKMNKRYVEETDVPTAASPSKRSPKKAAAEPIETEWDVL